MAVSSAQDNLQALLLELHWLEQVIQQAIKSYLKHDGHEAHWRDIPLPELPPSAYGDLLEQWQLDPFARLAVALGLAPQIKPECLDVFLGTNQSTQLSFSEFGGLSNPSFNGFLPTLQTLNFVIAGNDPLWQTQVHNLLQPHHILQKEQVLLLQSNDASLPPMSRSLMLSEQWLQYLLTGEKVRLELSSSFPAHPISTPMHWKDLILEDHVMEQVMEIHQWLLHGETLMTEWGLHKKIKPGYRALFFGEPGTGKTLTASLLAKATNREIYRVDLSMVVSKYIGETEKNLSKVFDVASYKDWILFFDEADALFGKRTAASSSNDRHANQQTGYLLQRIEDFPGVVILASNLRANMDEAFTRRFQSMVHFSMPPAEERLTLWQNAFDGVCELDEDVDLQEIAQNYELAGGAIINVLRQCSLSAISRNEKKINHYDLMESIRREFRKDNKTIMTH